jgi:hypothetical protein
MGVPTKFYIFVDGKNAAGLLTAARLNGDFDPLYACLDPASGGLEDTNVKSGAKIVCTDRAHTVTGVWTFTTAPVLPAGSVADSKLTSNVMLKTTYDTDTDGRVGLAVDSDTVDGQHAAAFAAAGTGVTNGDSHDHQGGDGAAIVRYALSFTSLTGDPEDSVGYFFGNQAGPWLPSYLQRRVVIPKDGTIKAAAILWTAYPVGTAENISVYITKNGTSDTLVETIGDTNASKIFDNAALSIAVVAGDYISIKVLTPAWVTNPADVYVSGVVYIE